MNHIDFDGRAFFGFAFDNLKVDQNGHGTHTAGTAASTTLGVAKKSNIIAVKVLDAQGSGTNDDIIAGLEFVINRHESRKLEKDFRGSVISMSLGSDTVSIALDTAVKAASKAGIHVSVAAGNSNKDACLTSPAGASLTSDVFSAGALNFTDTRAGFSNFGKCVSAYAPGVVVVSTFIDPVDPANGRNNIINELSGTSMACPHVTGLMAYYLTLFPELKTDTKGLKELIVKSAESLAGLKRDDGDPGIAVLNTGSL